MATNKIIVDVDVVTNTVAETKNANKLKAAFDAAAASAAKVGTAGSRRVAAAAARPVGSQEIMEYGAMRGTAGVTGASARDFANQAQGLGGLVRIYATYAANIFALTAAFRALSGAMDTSNMIEGLNQLGAASGKSLGNVSKELVRVTNGAVSLREAMEATVKGSSSGMMSADILRMGKVAQQASVALGVNMTDALSRISRGITKLEPELLDELSLFTKVDKSVQAYAKSVGKAESELTDFERRQAFANAVLEEGERKFSAIDIESNPYTQLAASIQNLVQEGLELVNKVLIPVVKLLSESPAALGLALAAIGTTIAKRTLPQLLDLKKNFDNFASEAAQKATARKAESLAAFLPEVVKLKQDAEAKVNAYYDTFEAAKAKYLARAGRQSKPVLDLLEAGPEATEEQIKAVENLQKRRKGGTELTKMYQDMTTSIREINKSETEYGNTVRKINEINNKRYNISTAQGQLQRSEYAAIQAARSKDILSQTAATASTKSLGEAFKQLTTSIAQASIPSQVTSQLTFVDKTGKEFTQTIKTIVPQMSLFRAGLTAVGGAATIAAVAAGRLGSALLTFLPYLGLAAAAFAGLDTLLSKNSRELAKVSEASDSTKGSIENLSRTIDLINKKSILEQFSTEGLEAKSNGINELASSVNNLITTTVKASAAAGVWDNFIDSIKVLWGGDLESKLSKGLIASIKELYKIQDVSALADLQNRLSEILDIPLESVKNIDEVSKAISNTASNTGKIEALGKEFDKLGKQAGINASRSRELKDAIKASADQYRDFLNTFKISDPFSKLILANITSLEKLQARLSEGDLLSKASALQETLSEIAKTNIFDVQTSEDLVKFGEKLSDINKQYVNQTEQLKKLTEQRKKLQEFQSTGGLNPEEMRRAVASARGMSAGPTPVAVGNVKQAIADLDSQIESLTQSLNNIPNKFDPITKQISELVPAALQSQIAQAAAKIGETIAKAGGQTAQGIYSKYAEIPELVRADTKARLQQLEAESKLINAIYDAILSQEELSAVLKVRNAQEEVAKLEGGGTAQEFQLDAAKTQLEAAKQFQTVISKIRSGESITNVLAGLPAGQNTGRIAEFAQRVAGTQAQMINLADKKKQLELEQQIKLIQAESFQTTQKSLEEQLKLNSENQKALELEVQKVGYADESAVNKRAQLSLSQAESQVQLDLEKIQVKYLQDLASVNALRTEGKDTEANRLALEAIFGRMSAETLAIAKNKNQITEAEVKKAAELKTLREAEFAASLEIAKLQESSRQTLEQIAIFQMESAVQDYERLGFSKEFVIQQQAALEIFKQEAATKQEIFNLELAYVQRIGELLSKRGPDTDRLIAAEQARFTQAKAAAEFLGKEKILNIKVKVDFDTALEKITQFFDSLKQSVAGLGATFGGIAPAIESTITKFAEFASIQQVLSKQLQETEETRKALADEGINESQALSEQYFGEETKKRKELTKTELTGYQQTIGAAKGMFKEKTVAYKALAATEKAIHIVRLAMEAKELFVKLTGLKLGTAAKVAAQGTETAAENAGLLARMPALIAGITGKITSQTGIAGPAIAAGIVAAIFAAFGGGRGGGSASVPTSAQRQEVTGTAMSYDASGQLVQTRMGVLGDTSAKSETITKSLELLAQNSVDGLRYDNRMTKALEKLLDSIDKVAAAIFKFAPAISGSTSALARITGVQTGTTGGSNVNIPIIGGLFGSNSTTTQLNDSGIKLNGTFLDLYNSGQKGSEAITGFAEYLVTSSRRRLLGGSRTSTSTRFEEFDLDPRVLDQLQKAYRYAGDFLIQLGEEIGFTAQEIIDQFEDVPITQLISLKGLKGEELAKALQAAIGSDIDAASEIIFDQYMRFVKPGEAAGEALVRVISNNRKVEQSLKNIGTTTIYESLQKTGVLVRTSFERTGNIVVDGINSLVSALNTEVSFDPKDLKLAAIEATEALIEIAGGIDKFLADIEAYRENFMSEAERMEILREEVYGAITRMATEDFPLLQTALDALGLSLDPNAGEAFLDTGDEFKLLMTLLGLLGIEGQKAATALRTVSADFAKIAPAAQSVSTEKILDFIKDLNKQAASVQKQIDRLGATSYEQAIWTIVDNVDNLIEKLRELGPVTVEGAQAIADLAYKQLELLDAQNARKAAEIITTVNAELAARNLGDLGRELTSISQKARSYAQQLVDLGQATEANISAIRAWESTMMEAARASRLAAQEATYAELFATSKTAALATKFRQLGFSLPSNITQLKYLIDSIDTTTDAGIELRGALLSLGSEFQSLISTSSDALRSAFDARVQELETARSQFEQFGESLKSFRQSLLTGALSPLTPAQRYAQTKSEFERIAALAASGDISAIEKLESVSSAFLEASRGMYASSDLYTQDFNQVLSVLDSSISITERQMQTAENTLAEVRAAVGQLIDISDSSSASQVELTGLGPKLTQAIADYSNAMSQSLSDTSMEVLAQEIATANETNSRLGNISSGVDQVDFSVQSATGAINALNTQITALLKEANDNTVLGNIDTNGKNLNSIAQEILDTLRMPPPSLTITPPESTTPTSTTPVRSAWEEQYKAFFGFYPDGTGGTTTTSTTSSSTTLTPTVVYDPWGNYAAGSADTGTNYITKDQPLFVHEGERIMPKADNTRLFQTLDRLERTESNNAELQAELIELRKTVGELIQVVVQGAVVNADATNRNTNEIATTIREAIGSAVYTKKMQSRTSII
jgi:predicted  nucleic acid-binding Zn-ribbon protein